MSWAYITAQHGHLLTRVRHAFPQSHYITLFCGLIAQPTIDHQLISLNTLFKTFKQYSSITFANIFSQVIWPQSNILI